MHTYRHTFLRLLPRKRITHSEHRPVSGLNIIGMFKSFGESPAEVVFLTTKPGHFFVGHPKLLSENRRRPRCFIFFTGRRMGLPFEHNRVRKSIIPESMKFATRVLQLRLQSTEPGYFRILEAINIDQLGLFESIHHPMMIPKLDVSHVNRPWFVASLVKIPKNAT